MHFERDVRREFALRRMHADSAYREGSFIILMHCCLTLFRVFRFYRGAEEISEGEEACASQVMIKSGSC